MTEFQFGVYDTLRRLLEIDPDGGHVTEVAEMAYAEELIAVGPHSEGWRVIRDALDALALRGVVRLKPGYQNTFEVTKDLLTVMAMRF